MKFYLFREINVSTKQFIRKMRTTCLLLFVLASGVFATPGSSQVAKVSINLKNAAVAQVLDAIESQTDYLFVYSKDEVDLVRKISVEAEQQSVAEVLTNVFDKTNIVYAMEGTNIMLMERSSAQQQGKKVTGKVTDSGGSSLPGVSVVVKGTTTGVITDNNGNYSLSNLPENATLQFSFVGMKTQEIAVGSKSAINVTLAEETTAIEEVVAIGYGVVKKSDFTGSLSQIKSAAINQVPATNVLQALNGKASGVQVLQNDGSPGGAISIRIRGNNSLRGNNEPLYVIDGFPSSPTVLNNSDIESIEILKDASSTAIYGSRGANGVVLITTKRGKEGRTNVDFETSYTSQSLIKKLDLMNAKEYAQFSNIQQLNDTGKEFFSQSDINNFGTGTNWLDLVTQTAPILATSLNINSGNAKTKFSISGSTFLQDGIVKGSDYNRYSFRSNIDHKFNNFFSASLSSTFSRINTKRKDSGTGSRGNTLMTSAMGAPPTFSPYKDDGTYRVLRIGYPFVATDLWNPVNLLNEQNVQSTANSQLINGALIFNPVEKLTIKVAGGIENIDTRSDNYSTRKLEKSSGAAYIGTNQYTSLLNENTISYNNTFNDKHSISVLAGFTYQDFLTKTFSGGGIGFLSDNFETSNLGAAETPVPQASGYVKSVLLSYLGRVNYSYAGKYLATISYRADGSSKFSNDNKWGYFPSAALAWKVSEEDFLKNNNTISDLKIRTSFGASGSQAIEPYVTLNQLFAGKAVFNDAVYTSFSPGTNLPASLKWETTEQLDFGVDLGILQNRILFTADYYIKNTKDLLNAVSLPASQGFATTIQNVGKVQNKGFDFGLDAKVFTGVFKWTLNANISANRNKVVKLYDGADIYGYPATHNSMSGTMNILREGQPVGRFFGFVEDGYDANGKIKYKDLDNSGSVNDLDRTYIGDPNPGFIYGLNSEMSFKNFELSIFLQGSQGNDIYNLSKVSYAYDYGFGLNMIKEVLDDHWTPATPNAKYPKISLTNYRVSDRFVEDGSYLRLKNIQLAYNMPVEYLKLKWIKSLQVYLSGQNLLTLTKYSGWDPEVNATGAANTTTFGIDDNRYPNSKSFTVGIRARF